MFKQQDLLIVGLKLNKYEIYENESPKEYTRGTVFVIIIMSGRSLNIDLNVKCFSPS